VDVGPRRFLRDSLTVMAMAALGFGSLAGARVAFASRDATASAHANPGRRDVAIVPGSSLHHGKPGAMLAERLKVALDLHRSHRVDSVLVSGNEAAGETSAMTTWLVDHGVPRDHVLVDREGTRTLETMRHASHVMGIQSAFVCTQPISMARAIYLARAHSIDAIPAPAALDLPRMSRWTLIEAAKSVLAVAETVTVPSSAKAYVAAGP
jgi:vancomycin permeability regulator SanA